MPLVTSKQLLDEADKKGYAVPAFNAYNGETVTAVIKTAVKMNSPVIIQCYNRLFESYDAQMVAGIAKEIAKHVPVPIALHLDHGQSLDFAVKALRYGYTSVMYDGSTLPFGENAKTTALVSELCHCAGVSVEGELGHVGSAALGDVNPFTEPDEAKEFVSLTNVDFLAVMVGSAHGAYKKPPKLDIERIAKIRKACERPLVLHGGSGIPDEEIKKAISAGIRKINFATDICQAFYSGFRYLAPDDALWDKAIDVMLRPALSKVCEFIEAKIILLGSKDQV